MDIIICVMNIIIIIYIMNITVFLHLSKLLRICLNFLCVFFCMPFHSLNGRLCKMFDFLLAFACFVAFCRVFGLVFGVF